MPSFEVSIVSADGFARIYICRLCDDQVFHRLSGVFEGTLL